MVQLLPLRRRGATRYFTRSMADPCATTLVDEVLRLRAAVRAVHQRMPFRIDAWVVLPDHLHTIWTLPAGDTGFDTRWQAIMEGFASAIPDTALTPQQIAAKRGGLWAQGGDMHEITDRDAFEMYRLRCWNDPVRHGFVSRPQDWSYSSYHRDASCCGDGLPVLDGVIADAGGRMRAEAHQR